ncbi:universal stress protein [Maritimibacter sp. 55A14]|uniref:universal stress protein n=1 Tax=Maritimibacter sp. 55A14 TaxID=2174844 RepID=UPI000D60857F|nr:universal stress protein [Maritimibacter sp. 55A14]PWE33774.1 universal stress protein [Maritimibacter sp. 55A14]
MSTSVLCAVDVSQPKVDIEVLKTAARLAALDGARLDVITVVPDFGMSMVGGFFEEGHHDAAVGAARKALKTLVEKALGAEANKEIRHVVATGNAYEQILQTAAQAGTDLIVIGAHKPDFKDYLLGPNAARVVRHADCSVHVVRV